MAKKKKASAISIWWIDDDYLRSNSDNKRIQSILNRDTTLKVDGMAPQKFESRLIQRGAKPDIFLVDYRLNENADPSGERFPFHGTALVGPIREKCPEHPVYLVSRILEEDDLNVDAELFDRLLTHSSLNDKQKTGKHILSCDAEDYRRIRETRGRGAVSALLNVPQLETELLAILPPEFQRGIPRISSQQKPVDSLSGVIRFARWVRRQLLRFPGPLFDDLYAATYLGVSHQSFIDKYSNVLLKSDAGKEAMYDGIFSRTTGRRWWKGVLSHYVVSGGRVATSRIWELGPTVLNAAPAHLTKCVVCRKPRPETVGVDPDDPSVRGPVHWSCSTIDDKHFPLPHFEQRRFLINKSGK